MSSENINLMNVSLGNVSVKLGGYKEFAETILGENNLLYTDLFCVVKNDERDCNVFDNEKIASSIIRLWEKAVQIQDALYYNEPPDWYYTSREALGFAHLKQASDHSDFSTAKKSAQAALQVFDTDRLNNKGSGRTTCGWRQSMDMLDIQYRFFSRMNYKEADRQYKREWKNATMNADMNLPVLPSSETDGVDIQGDGCPKLKPLARPHYFSK